MNSTLLRNAYLLATAVILFFVGIFLLLASPKILDLILSVNMKLKPDNHVFDMWKKNPIPLHLEFYFFNWTNPHDIHNASIKPRFEQIGPYVFGETKEKVNITFHPNDTVSFRQLRHWYFDASRTKGSLQDIVVTVNPTLLTAAHQIKDWNYIVKAGFSFSSRQSSDTLHVAKPVGELLFDGYEDPLIEMGKMIPSVLGLNMPSFDKFGWFYTRNGSSTFDGDFNMATGVGNQMGELLQWNYYNYTPYNSDECGKVHGSAGELYPPISSKTSIGFFSPDMCRYVPLDYSEEVAINDVKGYKFVAGPGLLDNGSTIPENLCYCGGECPPSGVVNVSACRYGSPSFVSLPHFYGADPYYIDAVEGLKPLKRKHEFFMVLEPTTGIALEVAARLQLNLLLHPVENIQLFEDVPKLFFPVLWFEQKVTIPEEITSQVKLLLDLPMICTATAWVAMAMSSLISLLLVYILMRRKRFHVKTDYSIANKEKEAIRLKNSNFQHYVPKGRKARRKFSKLSQQDVTA